MQHEKGGGFDLSPRQLCLNKQHLYACVQHNERQMPIPVLRSVLWTRIQRNKALPVLPVSWTDAKENHPGSHLASAYDFDQWVGCVLNLPWLILTFTLPHAVSAQTPMWAYLWKINIHQKLFVTISQLVTPPLYAVLAAYGADGWRQVGTPDDLDLRCAALNAGWWDVVTN